MQQWVYTGSIPDGMAIDTISRLVYYTDTGLDIVAVMTLDGSHHFTLVTEDMSEPRAIVLHPAKGSVYLFTVNRSTSHNDVN